MSCNLCLTLNLSNQSKWAQQSFLHQEGTGYLLAIIISLAKVKEALASQFFQPFVNVFSHCIVVFICFVAQSEYLEREKGETRNH